MNILAFSQGPCGQMFHLTYCNIIFQVVLTLEETSNRIPILTVYNIIRAWDAEAEVKRSIKSEKEEGEKLQNFIQVMKNVYRCAITMSQGREEKIFIPTYIYRFLTSTKRAHTQDCVGVRSSKRSRMDTSTPLRYREVTAIDLPSSPISKLEASVGAMSVSGSSDATNDRADEVTPPSGMSNLDITPPKNGSPNTEAAKTFVAANDHCDSLNEYRKRSKSVPSMSRPAIIVQQSLISENKSKSFGSFGDLFDSWEEVKSVSGIDNDGVDVDDSTAECVPQVLEDDSIRNVNDRNIINPTADGNLEENAVVLRNAKAGVDDELDQVIVEKNIKHVVDEAVVLENDKAGVDDELDPVKVEKIIKQLNENKLFGIFKAEDRWKRGVMNRKNNSIITPKTPQTKRKSSPQPPTKKSRARKMEVDTKSPANRHRASTISGSSGCDIKKGKTRSKSCSVDPKQILISNLLPRRKDSGLDRIQLEEEIAPAPTMNETDGGFNKAFN